MRYRYEWALDVREHDKRPHTQARLLMLLHEHYFFVGMMKRHPRRVVHVSCTDVSGKRGQFYAQLYVKLVLKAEFCWGR